MLTTVFLIVSVILFLVAARPSTPYSDTLTNLGLAFLAGSFLTPHL